MVSLGERYQLRKKRPMSREQVEFIKKIEEEKRLKEKELKKQEFLKTHKLVEIKTRTQARKILNDLNSKCGNCSRLLNKDELNLRNKLAKILTDNKIIKIGGKNGNK